MKKKRILKNVLYRLSSIQSCDNFNFIFNNSKLIDKKIQMKDTLQKLINMDDATKSMKNETNSLRKDPRNVSSVAATTTTNTDGIDGENGKDNNQTSTLASSIIVEKSIIDPYGDRGYYRGELLQASATTSTYDNNDYDDENIPHGLGTMEYSDGRIYEGKWKDGQWNDDNGKATYPNGDMYKGNFFEDQRHGKGKYIWKDGRIYEGAFSNDHRCGYGIYSWPDNSIYKGEFYNGLRHGKGTYTFHDKSVYIGEWKKGSREGTGEYRWGDGHIYKGEWIDGKKHGYGVENRPDGSVRHDGRWENDKPILLSEETLLISTT